MNISIDSIKLTKLCLELKQTMQNQSDKWLTLFRPGEPLSEINGKLRIRTKCVDQNLQKLWKALHMPKQFAMIAVGGYGRGELFPFSDIDIMLLLNTDCPNDNEKKSIESFCSACWDIGLEIGSSVRTIPQCLEEANADSETQTALLESRYLCGNKKIFSELVEELKSNLDPRKFFQKKRLEYKKRHAKFAETPYSLEPNCKESPGGLRDLQTIRWIAANTTLGITWSEMASNELLTPFEAAKLRKYERTLKRLRYQLHVLANRREDRLTFELQTQLAESLGYTTKGDKRISEVLMQEYYLVARAVYQLVQMLLQNIEELLLKKTPVVVPINEVFQAKDDLLDIRDPNIFNKDPKQILMVFLTMQQNLMLKGVTSKTQRALWHNRIKINQAFRAKTEHKQLFIQIFKQPQRVGTELRRMNQLGILGRYLPVFGRIVGQMQHDLFHVYTVDQHIMMVIKNLRRFVLAEYAHEYPFCSQLMTDFHDNWLLYLAALFHDVAKGRGGDHSLLGEKDCLKFCKQHDIHEEDTELVMFLVKHHLTMSNTAQKEDLSEQSVIENFSQIVRSQRRLTALYLLTVADIRGTSPKVWNAWKDKLLYDLYRVTLQHLGGNKQNNFTLLGNQKNEARRILKLYALLESAQDALWKQLEVPYFLRQTPSEIAWHTRHLFNHVNTASPIVKARLSQMGEGIEVLVYTKDTIELFARICEYFQGKSNNILDAKIHTTKHNYALDSFVITGDFSHFEERKDLYKIEQELINHLEDQKPLEQPTFGRLSRQSRSFPVKTKINLRADQKGDYFLLEFTTSDRSGLLYSVARLLTRYGINVRSAKIMTLGDRAEDILLIYGANLASQKIQIKIESELMEILSV